MKHFPAGSLASGALPFGRRGELISMLRAYFDDSGTHKSSDVVVWGGVVGSIGQFDKLEGAWGDMLAEPLPHKPRLSAFSLGDCRWANKEFENYKPPERDALRYRVREIIKSSGVHCVAYAIPIQLYNSIIRGRARRDFGAPSGIAFASCADFALQISERLECVPMACVFDKGQEMMDPSLPLFLQDADRRAAVKGVPISYSFAPVGGTYGLQAADTIATEHYWFTEADLLDPEGQPAPHFLSLMQMADPDSWTLSEREMMKMRDDYYRMHPISSWLKKLAKRT